MDAEGVLFREYPRLPGDLPVVHTFAGADAEARREAAGVVAALPAELAARVDHLEVVTIDQITLVLRDGRNVMWGSAARLRREGRGAGRLLLRHQAQQYDVSVPAQPTTEVLTGRARTGRQKFVAPLRVSPGIAPAALPSVVRNARLT